MKVQFPTDKTIIFISLILYLVGIVIHIVPLTRPYAIAITEPFLFLVNLSFLLSYLKHSKSIKLGLYCLFTILITVIIEIIGAATGKVFGAYAYSDLWRINIISVPLIIGINWVMLLLGAMNVVFNFLGKNKWYYAFVTGLLLAGIDIFIEPVAIALDYWQWEKVTPPMQNFIAWFCIGTVLHFIGARWVSANKWKALVWYFAINTVFFGVLYFAL